MTGAAGRRRLLLLLFVLFWTTHGGKVFIGDTLGSLRTAQAVVERGELAIDPGSGTEGNFGPGGGYYAWFGLVPMLVQLPAAWLGHHLPGLLGGVEGGGRVFASRFLASLPFLLVALWVCASYRRCLGRLGVAPPVADRAALHLGVATPVWAYAGLDAPDLLLGGLLLAAFDAGLARAARRAGFFLGLAVATKFYAFAAIPGIALLLVETRRPGERPLRDLALGLLPGLLGFMAFNQARFGGPLTTGYAAAFSEAFVPFPLGLVGMLLSPGKGLLVHAPAMLLAGAGFLRLAADRPGAARGLALTTAPILLGVSLAYDWAGDPGWGPRYAMAVVPLLFLAYPWWLGTEGESSARRGVTAAALGVGLLANVAGTTQDVTLYSVRLWEQLDRVELARRDGVGGPAVHLRAHYWIADLSPLRAHLHQARALFGGSSRMVLPSGWIERKNGPGEYRLMEPPALDLPAVGLDVWWLRFRPLAGQGGTHALLYALALLGWLGALVCAVLAGGARGRG